MSAEGARRALNMTLSELVRHYRSQAGEFGRSVALFAFPLDHAEIERLFSSYDEDYHISRFFHFSESEGQKFSINGIPATHVSLDAEIETIL
ncbi:MAG TPA: hypothetical protein VJN92_24285 [Candidatus Acidoferrum sp.]|nr:hypothetical protein [Candidatus Acidoferrum sp.]